MPGFKKLGSTPFGTDAFKALDKHAKAQFILDNQTWAEVRSESPHARDALIYDAGGLYELTVTALEYLATLLIRAQCRCKLIESYYDELDEETKTVETPHDRACPRDRIPVLEDYAESTLRRRAEKEILFDPYMLPFLEENTTA